MSVEISLKSTFLLCRVDSVTYKHELVGFSCIYLLKFVVVSMNILFKAGFY